MNAKVWTSPRTARQRTTAKAITPPQLTLRREQTRPLVTDWFPRAFFLGDEDAQFGRVHFADQTTFSAPCAFKWSMFHDNHNDDGLAPYKP